MLEDETTDAVFELNIGLWRLYSALGCGTRH